jgi:hypothetical protein
MRASKIVQGLRYWDKGGERRIMCVAEGYAMVRRHGLHVPALYRVKDLVELFNNGTLWTKPTEAK